MSLYYFSKLLIPSNSILQNKQQYSNIKAGILFFTVHFIMSNVDVGNVDNVLTSCDI